MGLPVLMYHDITDRDKTDHLTVSVEQLEKQFAYILRKKYQALSLSQIEEHLDYGVPLPPKSILLTFDDGFESVLTLLQPLLKRYSLRAVVFLTGSFIDRDGEHSERSYLSTEQISQIDPEYIEFACHSFSHKNYNLLSKNQILDDLQQMFDLFTQKSIQTQSFFAYPFGAYPKGDRKSMRDTIVAFSSVGIKGAFRIGNRINRLPLLHRFEIERLDVRGTDSFLRFKWMLRVGRKVLL